MAREHPNRRLPGWRVKVRRRAALVLVAVALVGLLVVVTAAGWAGWLVDHPGQAWRWVVRHWFVPPALAVVVALLTAWATWAARGRSSAEPSSSLRPSTPGRSGLSRSGWLGSTSKRQQPGRPPGRGAAGSCWPGGRCRPSKRSTPTRSGCSTPAAPTPTAASSHARRTCPERSTMSWPRCWTPSRWCCSRASHGRASLFPVASYECGRVGQRLRG